MNEILADAPPVCRVTSVPAPCHRRRDDDCANFRAERAAGHICLRNAAGRTAIVAQLSAELRSRYTYPVVAERDAIAIAAAADAGDYDRIVALPAFTTRLTDDLRAAPHDKHLVAPISR